MRKRHYACGCAECARLDLAFVGEGIQLGLPLPPPPTSGGGHRSGFQLIRRSRDDLAHVHG